jgi:hypothetical protein
MTFPPAQDFSPTPYPEVNTVLSQLFQGVRQILRDNLLAFYLYGSLASGDFNPRSSDIDFVVVTTGDLCAETVAELRELHTRLAASGQKWASKLEGSYVPREILRRNFPNGPQCPTVNEGSFYLASLGSDWIFQRQILRDGGVVLAGPYPQSIIDPVPPEQLRQAVLSFLNEWWRPMLDESSRLRSREYQAYAVLTMCRALYTLEHNTIASKPVSARWAQLALGAPYQNLIEKALAWPDEPQPDRFEETLDFIRAALASAEKIA